MGRARAAVGWMADSGRWTFQNFVGIYILLLYCFASPLKANVPYSSEMTSAARRGYDGLSCPAYGYDIPQRQVAPDRFRIRATIGPKSQVPGILLSGPSWWFTGKERDAESSLDYFGVRYFSGAQGRFTSLDPEIMPRAITNPQLWNRYAYTYNNPLRYTDPDGRAPQEGAAHTQDRDVRDLVAGRITRSEYMDRQAARGLGAATGAAGVVGFFAPEILGGAAAAVSRWFSGLGPAAAQFLQDETGSMPPGGSKGLDIARFAADAGFRKGALALDNMVAGELANGGSAQISVHAVGQAIQVGVPIIGSPEKVVGPLFSLSKGLVEAARAQGATSLTIRAVNVAADVAKVLVKRGYERIGDTNDYQRIITY